MRLIGFILLAAGFFWIGYDAAIGFTDDQYQMWIGYSKTKLPNGDPVGRKEVVGVMRELCLALKDRHRIVILPACMMLAGGLIVGASGRQKMESKHEV